MRRSFFNTLWLVFLLGMLLVSPAAAAEPTPQVQKANALFDRGIKAAQKGDLDEAESQFKAALAEYPQLPGAYVELGKIQMARGNPRGAVDYYLQARDAYQRLHSEKLLNLSKQQNADREFAQAGIDAKRNGNYASYGGFAKQSALATKDERKEGDRNVIPENPEAEIPALFYLYLSGAYMRLGQNDLAEKEILTGLQRDDKLAPLHFNLAVIYLAKGRFEDSATQTRLARQFGFQLPPAFVQDLETRGNLKL